MRKVIVLEHISLDGVIQSPGGPDEDTSGGFAYGGWISPYSDEILGMALRRQMNMRFDLLLGRKTFEIWAPYWPQHADAWLGVNTATKYVASSTMTSHEWQPSVFLNGDIAEKVAKIKQQQGPDLHVWGSGNLLQTLIKHDLVDTFWLMIYPITLGGGKRLFTDGTIPVAFKLTESIVCSNGVIVVNYERAGAITSRSMLGLRKPLVPESTMSNEQVIPETKGVTVKLLSMVDLGPEIEGMAGRQLRMRMVTIEPGGVFGPIHDHKDRPGIVYILQGTITDHRDGVATDYGPGVGWPEDRNTTHWLENRGTIPAVEISVDIVRQE